LRLAIPFPSQHQTLIHNNSGKFQPEPFRKFLHAYSKLLKVKAGDFHDIGRAPLRQNAAADILVGAKRMNQQSGRFDKIALVRVHDGRIHSLELSLSTANGAEYYFSFLPFRFTSCP
jgi:hypothetical protein